MDAGRSTGGDESSSTGMKVVIAGGAGSLGRRVADDFARRDHEVVILGTSKSEYKCFEKQNKSRSTRYYTVIVLFF